MNENRSEPTVNLFITILDKGFHITIPANQENLYRRGHKVFLEKVEIYKKKHLPVEAVALASLDCMVAFQKSQAQLKELIEGLENQMDDLDTMLLEAL